MRRRALGLLLVSLALGATLAYAATYRTVTATTDVTSVPSTVVGLQVTGGSDIAEYEVRDGDTGSSTLVCRLKAPIGDSRYVSIPEVSVNKLRVAKISGTASEATVYYR